MYSHVNECLIGIAIDIVDYVKQTGQYTPPALEGNASTGRRRGYEARGKGI